MAGQMERAAITAIRISIQIILAVISGVLLLMPLAWLFGAMNWPTYHSWGLIHGGSFSAIPSLSIAAYSLLGTIPWFKRPDDIWRRIVGLAIGMAITSLLVLALPHSPHQRWTSLHYAFFLIAFAGAVGLCYSAKVPPLVVLMIPLPLLFNDSQYFMMSGDALWAYILYNVVPITLPVIVAAALGCLVSSVLPRS